MPTASDGAPPVRANNVDLAHLAREGLHLLDRDRKAPARDRRDRGFRRVAPTTPGPLLIAK